MARVAGRMITREEVAEAAWRVILRDGLHKASMRAIATELGATTGVVTYHFHDKAELLLFALDRLGTAIVRDMDAALAGVTGIERVRRILRTTLPLGPRQVAGWKLWVSFVGLAMSDTKLRDEHQRRLAILNGRLEFEIRALQARGDLSVEIDARHEADALVALSDGIGLGYTLRPKAYPPDKQWAIVDGYMTNRFELPRPRRPRVARR